MPPRDGQAKSLLQCTSAAADYCRDEGDEKPPMRIVRPRYEYFEQPDTDESLRKETADA